MSEVVKHIPNKNDNTKTLNSGANLFGNTVKKEPFLAHLFSVDSDGTLKLAVSCKLSYHLK